MRRVLEIVIWCIACAATAAVVCAMPWLYYMCPFPPREADRAEVQLAMFPIIKAIDRFHADNGKYPSSLNELTPEYMKVLPPPPLGAKSWQYRAGGRDKGFIISVYLRRETIDYRTDLHGGWAFRDSDFYDPDDPR